MFFVENIPFHVDIIKTTICSFNSITLTPEEGGGSVELVTNGRNIQVNEVNVYDYVRLYANYRLVKTHEKSLEVSAFLFLNSDGLDLFQETQLMKIILINL